MTTSANHTNSPQPDNPKFRLPCRDLPYNCYRRVVDTRTVGGITTTVTMVVNRDACGRFWRFYFAQSTNGVGTLVGDAYGFSECQHPLPGGEPEHLQLFERPNQPQWEQDPAYFFDEYGYPPPQLNSPMIGGAR